MGEDWIGKVISRIGEGANVKVAEGKRKGLNGTSLADPNKHKPPLWAICWRVKSLALSGAVVLLLVKLHPSQDIGWTQGKLAIIVRRIFIEIEPAA